MSSEYRIEVERNLIYKKHHGKITVEDEINLLDSIFEDRDFRQGMDAICDFTEAKVDWDLADLDKFRAYITRIKYVTGNCKWALIFPKGNDTSTARLFIAFNEAIGGTTIAVKLFDNRRDAMGWLENVKISD